VSVLLPDIWIINCSKNKIDHYKSYDFQYLNDAFFDVSKKYLLTKNKKQNNFFISIEPSAKMLKNKIETFPFYIEESSFSFLFFIIILLIGILVVIYFKKQKKRISSSQSKPQLILKENQLFIGDRNINTDLTLLEFRILKTFIELNPQPIDIVSLNELFEDETTSLAAQKKRRETTLKSLREKLAFFLNTSQEQVFLESRDLTDKRIKKFVINPDIIAD
jgi:cbb3-type cytochrome oxidase subunit 3